MLERIKKGYYYFFYKLYKFWDYVSVPKFATDFKAIISIIALEIWLCFSCLDYYLYINNIKVHLNFFNPFIFFPFILLIVVNYIAFIHNDYLWRKYNEEFDNLPRNRNIIGGIIVWFVIVSIVVINFYFT